MTRVRVKVNGQSAEGLCLLVSENKQSLGILLDEALHTSHGMYCNALPLLWNEERQCYEELVGGEAVEVEWLK